MQFVWSMRAHFIYINSHFYQWKMFVHFGYFSLRWFCAVFFLILCFFVRAFHWHGSRDIGARTNNLSSCKSVLLTLAFVWQQPHDFIFVWLFFYFNRAKHFILTFDSFIHFEEWFQHINFSTGIHYIFPFYLFVNGSAQQKKRKENIANWSPHSFVHNAFQFVF